MTEPVWKIQDKCIYDGLVAIIEDVSHVAGHPEIILLSLVSECDPELTCSVRADEVLPYTTDPEDQKSRLEQAHRESRAIAGVVDSMTDKYIGDCSF